MNLDATQIAIRERGFGEIMDLGLTVGRAHLPQLLGLLVVGATPWALLNGFLLSDLVDDSLWENPSLYFFWMVILVAIQAPIATAPMTLYLGQVTFAGRGDARRIATDFFRCLPQMFLFQGIARSLTAMFVITLIMPYVLWPCLSEIILLERSPLLRRKGKDGQLRQSTRRRSKILHRTSGGDLFSRWLLSATAGALLVVAGVGGTQVVLLQLFSFEPTVNQVAAYIFPTVLWLTVGYFAVVRFLAYLDLRIRCEGWEVELTMRAEATRLATAGAPA